MTGRAAAVQGALAALGLVTAHFTWQREPERAPGEVVVIDASKNDLGGIKYEDEKTTVELQRRKDGGDPVVWVRITDKPDPTNKTPNAPKPAPSRELRGSEAAMKLMDQFAPLRSGRAFGVLEAAKLKELGLEGAKKKIEVKVKGDARQYTVGQTGTGTSDGFLRDNRDGRVYLLPKNILMDLQAAQSRLLDRKLHAFEMTDVDRITVKAGGKTKELVQINRDKPQAAQLASAKTPTKADDTAKNWHERIWRTFPVELLGKGETPKEGNPQVVARIEYFDGKKSLGWLELAKTAPPAAVESAGPPAQGELFARSEHAAGWVKLHQNPTLLQDTEKVAASP